MKTGSILRSLRQQAVCAALALSGAAADAAVFNIDGLFDFTGTTLTPTQRSVFSSTFNQSAALWESLLTGYQSSLVPDGFSVTITAASPYIDGPGTILGQAGPEWLAITDSYTYTSSGSMQFDSADVDWMISNNLLLGVFEHEMAHVLGFGTLWNTGSWSNPVFAGTQQVYADGSGRYTGAHALAAWRSEYQGQSSASYVPVELGGGPGTADGHWNEADGGSASTGIVRVSDGRDMRDELMTGWLNPSSYISQTTVCSFRDIGYTTSGSCGALAVPAPLPLLGVVAALAWSRKLRRRVAAARGFSLAA